MGWSSGSELADDVWKAIAGWAKDRPPEEVEAVARSIVVAFKRRDADTLDECENPIGDAANRIFWERAGAPRNPTEGEVTRVWNTAIVFRSGRWQEVE